VVRLMGQRKSRRSGDATLRKSGNIEQAKNIPTVVWGQQQWSLFTVL